LFSCKGKVEVELFPDAIMFSMDDVELIHADNLRRIELAPLMQLQNMKVYDTILMIYGKSTVNDNILHIYNAKDGTHINSFASRGRGPDEFSDGFGEFKLLPRRREVYLYDMNYRKSVVYHLDSLWQEDLLPFESTTFAGSGFRLHLRLNSSDYVFNLEHYGIFPEGTSMMFGKYSAKTGEITKRVTFPAIEGFDTVLNRGHQRLIFPVTHMNIDYNDEADRIVLAYPNSDIIEVYDSDLNFLFRLHGPDQYLPEFEFSAPNMSGGIMVPTGNTYPKAKSDLDMVVFTEGKARNGYGLVEAHKGGFYVGYDGSFKPANYSFRKIFHFDYNGTPLRCYTFDRDFWGGRFTVDEKRGIIYIIGLDGEVYAYSITD